MKTMSLSVLLVLAVCSPLYAQITDPKAVFTAMCISDKSSGFDWRKGNWDYSNFVPSKYIVEKLMPEDYQPGKGIPRSGMCKTEIQRRETYLSEDVGYLYGCYNKRRFGSTFYSVASRVCLEVWKGKVPNRVLESVSCENSIQPFTFAPDGWFHLASIHENLENTPKDDYKDSLFVEVGKCAVISK